MEDLFDANKLALFLIFVIPGFIAIKTYSLFSPLEDKDSSKILIDAIAYSCINYGLLAVPIYLIQQHKNEIIPFFYYGFYLIAIFILPIILSCIFYFLRTRKFIQNFINHPTAKSWDFFFSKRECCFIIANLKDGKKLGGRYGINSFSSSFPQAKELYLEQEWIINSKGGFDRAVNESRGIIIFFEEIISIEIYDYIEGDTNE